MTLLASERSMLIRSKFRSVLQLRMQHRRSQEQHLLTSLTKPPSTCLEAKGTPEQSQADDTLKLTVQARTHKAGDAMVQFTEESGGDPLEQKEKKTRLAEGLKEKLLQRPGPLELVSKNILPLRTGFKDAVKADPAPAAPETFPFEDDHSSSLSASSSSSPRFTHSPGGTPHHSLPSSSSGAAIQPVPPSILGSQPPAGHGPDPTTQPLAGGLPVKAPTSLPKATTRSKKVKDPKPKVRKLKYHQYVPPTARPPRAPAPLDAAYARLLQQQQLFLQLQILQQQQPPASSGPPALCVPALNPLNASISQDPVISFAAPPITLTTPPMPPTPPVPPKPELLPANLDDLTVSELRQQLRQRGLPVSGTKPALLERLKPFQVRGVPGPPPPLSSSPPPALPPAERVLQEKQRLIDSLTWELRREQQEADDLREELQMRKRQRGHLEGEPLPSPPPPSHSPCTPTGETAEGTVPRRDGLLVVCPPSCEPIGEDLELPLQITASPTPAPRSLEEELQEAIQKAQLVPSESIEDILEEPLACPGDLLPAEPCCPPSPLCQQGTPCKKPRSSSQVTPLSAAILDFPSHYDLLTPPSSSSSSPSDSLHGVFSPESSEGPPSPCPRSTFDPVDWLEALTAGPASGLGPGTPGGGSIFSTDFFDSPDLSVNHMIDLMVEQW